MTVVCLFHLYCVLKFTLFAMLLISYNCRGYNNKKASYLNTLLSECDVLFLQEHWLLNNGVMRLSETFQRHHVYGKSGIVVDELLLGRPYGGVAIFINKNIKCFISEVDCESKRLCTVLCKFDEYSVLFVSIYMPCDERKKS